jgi:hypothetical protein
MPERKCCVRCCIPECTRQLGMTDMDFSGSAAAEFGAQSFVRSGWRRARVLTL